MLFDTKMPNKHIYLTDAWVHLQFMVCLTSFEFFFFFFSEHPSKATSVELPSKATSIGPSVVGETNYQNTVKFLY